MVYLYIVHLAHLVQKQTSICANTPRTNIVLFRFLCIPFWGWNNSGTFPPSGWGQWSIPALCEVKNTVSDQFEETVNALGHLCLVVSIKCTFIEHLWLLFYVWKVNSYVYDTVRECFSSITDALLYSVGRSFTLLCPCTFPLPFM